MALRVHGLQLSILDACCGADKQANVARALRAIRDCPASDLIVLPELCTIGYGERVFDNLPALADTVDGPILAQFAAAARNAGACVAVGFPERAGQHFFNSVAIFSSEGALLDVYRKAHLPQFADTRERDYFTPGAATVSFRVKGVNVGVIVCYDIRFPEISRKLAFDDDVDLLIHPNGFFRDETFASWHPFVITRAIENQLYVLSVNRAGGRCGCSAFCPPLLDWPTAMRTLGEEEGVIGGLVDDEVLAKVRKTYQYRQGRNATILQPTVITR